DYFDAIVVSDEIGHAKPQQGYFDHVFSQMGPTDLSKTIVIGDSLNSDIKGALDYGLDCVWLNPERKSHGGLKPTYEVRSVKEIIELFSI
ncbi:MAG: HAD-IA family hydrolase, partial [Saprospiraceae bacterium]